MVVLKSKVKSQKSKKRVGVKICGITNLADAKAAVKAGCDALGFVFYKKSPRCVSACRAKDIISRLPKHILKAGVFVNAREKDIKRIAKDCSLNMLQFHGEEPPRFCAKFKKYKVIKAIRIKDKFDAKIISKYKPYAFLFDTFSIAKAGGTGKRFNWKILKGIKALKRPFFLSGGLNPDNVKKAVQTVRPDWVDVSSGVEIRPGKKDYKKLKKFIGAVALLP